MIFSVFHSRPKSVIPLCYLGFLPCSLGSKPCLHKLSRGLGTWTGPCLAYSHLRVSNLALNVISPLDDQLPITGIVWELGGIKLAYVYEPIYLCSRCVSTTYLSDLSTFYSTVLKSQEATNIFE